MNASSSLPRLVRSDGREIPIDHPLVIGRVPECNIQLQDTRVSHQHARLELSGTDVTLTDLGSRNGTWVNEKKITAPTRLAEGDKVRIGGSIFIFKAAAVQVEVTLEPPTPPPAPAKDKDGTMTWELAAPLTLVRGDGAEFGLNSDSRLGRDAGNDITLEKDTSASQFHARLDIQDGLVSVTDLGSRNGTWVNGKRITQPVLLKHGDRIRIGNTIFRLRLGDNPLPPLDAAAQTAAVKGSIWKTSLGVSIGVTLLIVFCVGVIALGAWGIPKVFGTATATPTLMPGGIGAEATQEAQARNTALRAVVYVEVPDENTESTGMVATGSGSLLNEEGYVLTNQHVIEGNIGIFYIGLNWHDPTAEPNTFYQCELIAADRNLDLAVLHVIALGDGRPLPDDLVFPYLPVGDSDEVHIGDLVTLIGFPGIGGESPTLTAGTVSGFSTDEYNDLQNGWIKTDALISWGNSGGMAVNTRGELIGVPTQFTEESMEDKPLDTFLGLLRPINIALPMIQEYLP